MVDKGWRKKFVLGTKLLLGQFSDVKGSEGTSIDNGLLIYDQLLVVNFQKNTLKVLWKNFSVVEYGKLKKGENEEP